MVDIKQQNRAQPPPQPEPPSLKAPTPAYEKSTGDKLFDVGVFGGLGYIVNGVISVAVTRQAVHKNTTKLHQFSQHTEEAIASTLKHFVSEPKRVAQLSKSVNEVAFLGCGGWLLLLPMYWLEKNKGQLIKQIDELAGTTPKDDAALAAQQAYFENGPKQNFASLFAGRVLGYVGTIAVALPFVTKTTGFSDRLAVMLNKQVGPYLKEFREPLMVVDGKVTQMPILVDNVAKEIILAGTAAGLHYVSSKMLVHAGHAITQRTALPHQNAPTLLVNEASHDEPLLPKPAAPARTNA